jgi:uncharacterized membrane protein
MKKYVASYFAAAVLMLAFDAVWIGYLARDFYQAGIGHLMAASPRLGVAVLFYGVYALGLVVFVIAPQSRSLHGNWLSAMLRGALLGLVAYGTYDLTNLATLRDWPLSVALVDLAWGAWASACASLAGRAAWLRCSPQPPVKEQRLYDRRIYDRRF